MFPRGNRDSNQFISVYLDVADAEMLPDRWHRRASFKLMLVNQRDPARSITKGELLKSGCSAEAYFTCGHSGSLRDKRLTDFSRRHSVNSPFPASASCYLSTS